MALRPYWRDPTRFQIDYYPRDSYSKRERFILPPGTTEEEARSIEQSLINAKHEKHTDHITYDTTVSELFPEYLSWAELYRAKSTCRDLKGVFRLYLSKHLGSTKAEDINIHHINAYIKLRKSEKGSNRSINKEIDYLRGFLKWCRKNLRGFKSNIIKIEELPYKRPKPTILNFQEAIKIILSAEPFYRVFFLLLYSCGLRLNEARNLKWIDIDFHNRTIKVTQKGGNENILPISQWLSRELLQLKKITISDYVFQSPRKQEPSPIYSARKALDRAKQRAGIDKKINHHTFRHSIATHLLGLDINQKAIKDILGHADIKTTEWYTQVLVDNKRRAIEKAGFDSIQLNSLTKPLKVKNTNKNN